MFKSEGRSVVQSQTRPFRSPKKQNSRVNKKDESRSRSRSLEKEETYSHLKVKNTNKHFEDSPQTESLLLEYRKQKAKYESMMARKYEQKSPLKTISHERAKLFDTRGLQTQYRDYVNKNLNKIWEQKPKKVETTTSTNKDFFEDEEDDDDDRFYISKLILSPSKPGVGGHSQGQHFKNNLGNCSVQDPNCIETDSTLSDKNLNIFDEKSNTISEEDAPQVIDCEENVIPQLEVENEEEEEELPEVEIIIEYNEEDFVMNLPEECDISPIEKKMVFEDPRIKPKKDERLNLVLDLDETLLNAFTLPRNIDLNSLNGLPRNAISEIHCGGCTILVMLRPYLLEFLERVSKQYNIWIYSLGRYEYVMAALDIIDKERKYINRNQVFKNKDSSVFQKTLTNLNMTAEQKERTLILDDIPNIWVESNKVISSKKFIPFKNLLNKDRYNKYPLLVEHTQLSKMKMLNYFGWLSDHKSVNDLKYYSETRVTHPEKLQLEALTDFLEATAENYKLNCRTSAYLNSFEDLPLEQLYQKRRRNILKDVKLMILSGDSERYKTFRELSFLMGAEYTETNDAHYILVDAYMDQFSRVKMQKALEKSSKVKVVSVYWLVECFFLLKKISLQDFYGNSPLKKEFNH